MDPGLLLGIFVGWPVLALLPAAAFGSAWLVSRQRPVLLAGVAWASYFPYDMAMKLRLLCSGECNIRIDLLLFYPLLLLISIIAIVAILRRRDASRHS